MGWTSPEFNARKNANTRAWRLPQRRKTQKATPQQKRIPGGPRYPFPENWGAPPPIGPNLSAPMYEDMSANLPTPGALSNRFQAFGLPYVSPIGQGVVPFSTLRVPGPPDNRFDPSDELVPGFGLGQSAWTIMSPGLPLQPVLTANQSASLQGLAGPGFATVTNLNKHVQVTQTTGGTIVEKLKNILKPKKKSG